MNGLKRLTGVICALGIFTFLAAGLAAKKGIAQPLSAGAAAKEMEVTGQHRGYTNDKLYLRLDDEKEMTFHVEIPGDKEWRWHQEFADLSRITVTYHQSSSDPLPVATAIRKATEAGKP